MDKLKVAVAGATGVVGQFFVSLLSNHPFFEVKMVTASIAKKGLKYIDAIEYWVPPAPLPDEIGSIRVSSNEDLLSNNDIDLVFSALPKETAEGLEPKLAYSGKIVVSNSSNFRLMDDIPLLNPEVNIHHIALVESQKKQRGWKGAIIKNPNCTTAILTLTLKPIHDLYGIKKITITTMQAISGAGLKGHTSMEMHGNVIPYIKNEEEKIIAETKKILGSLENNTVKPLTMKVFPTATRVPVLIGHTESVSIELNDKPRDIFEVKKQLSNWKGYLNNISLPTKPSKPIYVFDKPSRPQPRIDIWLEKGMSVGVGRMRLIDDVLNYIVVGNNLVRGAAGIAVLIAEYIYKTNPF